MGAFGGEGRRRSSTGWAAAAAAVAIAAAAATELAMGRPVICRCGVVRLWHGPVRSPENSQQLLDWYSPSHLVHGLILYAIARIMLPRWRWPWRLAAATLVEAVWEVAENKPAVIGPYRAVTAAWGYAGDSVLNSMGDIARMVAGFLLARRLPAWGSVAVAFVCELVALAAIRDGLTLNVVMLVHPVAAILRWQAGA